jgi:hypothetical protein
MHLHHALALIFQSKTINVKCFLLSFGIERLTRSTKETQKKEKKNNFQTAHRIPLLASSLEFLLP